MQKQIILLYFYMAKNEFQCLRRVFMVISSFLFSIFLFWLCNSLLNLFIDLVLLQISLFFAAREAKFCCFSPSDKRSRLYQRKNQVFSVCFVNTYLTSCNKSANKRYSHCLSQVANRFGTTCWQLVTTLSKFISLVARLFWQVRYMLGITKLLQPCVDNLVTTLLYHGCNKLVNTVLWQGW
jgi:low temperature requirement protein LtrA